MICELCNKSFSTIQGLNNHLRYKHKNITKEDYYLKYILPFDPKANSGKCIMCGKPTHFDRFKYHKYCSMDCERHDGNARNAQKAVETKRKTGVYLRLNRELVKKQLANGTYYKTRQKTANTMKENGMYKIIGQKSAATMKANGTYKTIVEKRIKTMSKNNTFNKSYSEDRCFSILSKIYANIIRNYASTLYPYQCDFYIPEEDLYIECNFHWTHAGHWFDKTNIDDINKLTIWKEKAKNSKYYENAIKTWTIRDLEKQNIAIKNNLNYMVFWSEEDFKQYFERKL